MAEQRRDPRVPSSQLPEVFGRLVVHTPLAQFSSRAVDAGANGLGLVASQEFLPLVTKGLYIVVDFGDFQVDAEVLHIYEGFSPDSFRFGVYLNRYYQLRPFWELLGNRLRA